MNYRDRLIADGFDCREGIIHVREEHLHFMTSAHRRTLISNINSVPVERWIYITVIPWKGWRMIGMFGKIKLDYSVGNDPIR